MDTIETMETIEPVETFESTQTLETLVTAKDLRSKLIALSAFKHDTNSRSKFPCKAILAREENPIVEKLKIKQNKLNNIEAIEMKIEKLATQYSSLQL